MIRRPRWNHSPAFREKVAVAAIKGEKTMIELSQEFDVHPNQIRQWRDQLLDGAIGVLCRLLGFLGNRPNSLAELQKPDPQIRHNLTPCQTTGERNAKPHPA